MEQRAAWVWVIALSVSTFLLARRDVMEEKIKLTRQERIAKLIAASEMRVAGHSVNAGTGLILTSLEVSIRGKLSAIPSTKNNRFHGRPDQTVMDKVIALEKMFNQHTQGGTSVIGRFYGPCYVELIIGSRDKRGDADNALTTIKDWLEPRTKPVGRKKHSRGWGVGIIENDSQVVGVAVRASQLGIDQEETVINIRPLGQQIDALRGCLIGTYKKGE